jgi:hypothetical protein
MHRAIVTVKLSGSDQEYDLEVPADIPSQQLAELITHNLGLGTEATQSFIVCCLKPEMVQRELRSQESLAAAGLWDGVYLEIKPAGASTWERWKEIVERWEPLRLDEIGGMSALSEKQPSAEFIMGNQIRIDPLPITGSEEDSSSERDDDNEPPEPQPPRTPGYVWKPL